MVNSFKENIKKQLLIAAQEYSFFLDKTILLNSEQFIKQRVYYLKFSKTNFLHLTGVISDLKPEEFFNKCFNGSVEVNDFDYDDVKNKTNLKNKLKCLVVLSTLFNKELLVQENFVRNNVICKIATSDGRFTIGFTGGERSVYPKTILNKNRLDETKTILIISPVIH